MLLFYVKPRLVRIARLKSQEIIRVISVDETAKTSIIDSIYCTLRATAEMNNRRNISIEKLED